MTSRGSPPHTRGTPSICMKLASNAGITPAHAGNTIQHEINGFSLQDHPRTRGEHSHRQQSRVGRGGSPPHMRGTRDPDCRRGNCCGITPAHAGNTLYVQRIQTLGEDHPRTCGEHRTMRADATVVMGSPPHMRGTPKHLRVFYGRSGITPAHAGNTRSVASTGRRSGDHPRTCGEHTSGSVSVV